MAHRCLPLLLAGGIALGVQTGMCRADSEADLLKKFQNQNMTAADKLKQEAARLLNSARPGQPSEKDLEAMQKLLVRLQDDVALAKEERTALIRKLQDRVRDANTASSAAGASKIRVSPSVLVVTNQGAIRVPDDGVAVLGSSTYLSEARSEGGVPIVGGVPYLGRLFRNVGYGRSIGSIQRSIHVRIIRMEEEEARFLGNK
jgi:hypothetical protein